MLALSALCRIVMRLRMHQSTHFANQPLLPSHAAYGAAVRSTALSPLSLQEGVPAL